MNIAKIDERCEKETMKAILESVCSNVFFTKDTMNEKLNVIARIERLEVGRQEKNPIKKEIEELYNSWLSIIQKWLKDEHKCYNDSEIILYNTVNQAFYVFYYEFEYLLQIKRIKELSYPQIFESAQKKADQMLVYLFFNNQYTQGQWQLKGDKEIDAIEFEFDRAVRSQKEVLVKLKEQISGHLLLAFGAMPISNNPDRFTQACTHFEKAISLGKGRIEANEQEQNIQKYKDFKMQQKMSLNVEKSE